jgi:hypothetical protein
MMIIIIVLNEIACDIILTRLSFMANQCILNITFNSNLINIVYAARLHMIDQFTKITYLLI